MDMDATLTLSVYDALVMLGVTALAISHVYRIFNLFWFYFLRPSSVKRYLHGNGPCAIVRGSTDGIGKATAAELLRRGFNLVLHGRNEVKMQRVVEELRASVTMDIRIDARTEEYLLGVVHSNALFALFLTRALLSQLRCTAVSGPVQVLVVGSFAGGIAPPRLPIYAASKGFLKVLTRGLNNDEFVFGAPTGVRFTYLSVGAVHSDIHPAPMPPSFGVPTSARFAWWLVESLGCGRRDVVPYLVHAIQYWIMQNSGERAVDEGMAKKIQGLMEQAAKQT